MWTPQGLTCSVYQTCRTGHTVTWSTWTDEGRRGFTSRSLSLGAEWASSRLSSWLRITSSCCPGERGLLPGTSHLLLPGTSHLLPGTSHLLLGTSRLSLQEETHIHKDVQEIGT